MRSPGSKYRVFSTLQAFLSRSEKKKKKHKKSGKSLDPVLPLTFFTLSKDEKMDNCFPQAHEFPAGDYVSFEDFPPKEGRAVLAIDCEMVGIY
jgi:hypothetical protein